MPKRIKDYGTAATTIAADDYFAIDGVTNGTRKALLPSIGATGLLFGAGTNAAPKFAVGTSTSGIFAAAAEELTFTTNSVEKWAINSAGNFYSDVQATPLVKFQPATATTLCGLEWYTTAPAITGFVKYDVNAAELRLNSGAAASTGKITFYNNNVDVCRITSAGNFTVGVTSSELGLTAAGGLKIGSTTSAVSSVAGAVVIGDMTAATTVAIGAGKLNAGTSVTAPLVLGGTSTTQDLTLQTTSGIGASGADMHFLVGNNGATEAMTILNSGNVGIGTTTPDGLLHVHSASAGTITPNANADDLIVENNGTAGISILTPDASIGYLVWGSPTAAVGAQVFYSHTSGILGFGTVKVGGILDIRADNNVANLTLSGASGSELASFVGNVKISKNTGGGIPAIQSLLNVFGGTTVGAGAPGILTLGNSGNVMTTGDILGSVDFYNNDASGSAAGVRSGMEGVIDSASGTGASLVFKTGIAATATEKARITSAGAFGIGTTAPGKALEINSATGANLRLTYNDSNGGALNYADFSTDGSGYLTIAPSGGVTTISGVMQATRTAMNGTGAASSIGMATDARTINDALVFGYVMQNSSSANVTYGSITTTITDPTAGSEDSTVKFNTILAGTPTLALTLTGANAAIAGNLTTSGVRIDSVQSLSGAGAVNVTTAITEVTTTGAAQALSLADGVAGQEKTIIHGVDGGSFVLTPTTKTGWSTFTSTAAGESITLVFLTTRGWIVKGSYLGVIAP